jgi:hypothetical protein
MLESGDAQAHGLGGHVRDGFCEAGWRVDLARTHVRGFCYTFLCELASAAQRPYIDEQTTSPRQERRR